MDAYHGHVPGVSQEALDPYFTSASKLVLSAEPVCCNRIGSARGQNARDAVLETETVRGLPENVAPMLAARSDFCATGQSKQRCIGTWGKALTWKGLG